jgi:hypothetical protein
MNISPLIVLNQESATASEPMGNVCHGFRLDLMSGNDEGLTKTYNRFHDPEETEKTSPDIHQLRALHAAMDGAVLAAYGWGDIVSGERRVANGEANSSSTLHGIVNPKQPSSTDSRFAELYQ